MVSIASDKLWHVIAGLVIGAFFAIVLPIEAPVVPVIFAGAIREFMDDWRSSGANWKDFAATVAGGGVIQVMVWVG